MRWSKTLIDAAIEDMRREKKRLWLDEYKKKNPGVSADVIKIAIERADRSGEFEPKKGTMTVKHKSGFIVMDLEGFEKLPKSQQNKILKLSDPSERWL